MLGFHARQFSFHASIGAGCEGFKAAKVESCRQNRYHISVYTVNNVHRVYFCTLLVSNLEQSHIIMYNGQHPLLQICAFIYDSYITNVGLCV